MATADDNYQNCYAMYGDDFNFICEDNRSTDYSVCSSKLVSDNADCNSEYDPFIQDQQNDLNDCISSTCSSCCAGSVLPRVPAVGPPGRLLGTAGSCTIPLVDTIHQGSGVLHAN
jgi:hypothetical protein